MSCLLNVIGLSLFPCFPVLHLQDSYFHFVPLVFCVEQIAYLLWHFFFFVFQAGELWQYLCYDTLSSVGSMCVMTFWRAVHTECASCCWLQSKKTVLGAWILQDQRKTDRIQETDFFFFFLKVSVSVWVHFKLNTCYYLWRLFKKNFWIRRSWILLKPLYINTTNEASFSPLHYPQSPYMCKSLGGDLFALSCVAVKASHTLNNSFKK